MQTFELYTYLSGACAMAYFLTCLVCGLQLRFNIFNFGKDSTKISRLIGITLLCWSFSALLYMLSDLVSSLGFLVSIGASIDVLAYTFLAFCAYLLYANRYPAKHKAIVLGSPYVVIAIIHYFLPDAWCEWMPGLASIILIIQYLHYYRALRRHERRLDEMYADPVPHSLRWLWTVLGLFVGWLALHTVFLIGGIRPLLDVTLYFYMVCIILFLYAKVCNYREPVSLETQITIEQVDESETKPVVADYKPLQKALIKLMEEEKAYLNPNLTVDDVVKMLNTNTKYFYFMLRDDMHTNFSHFVNEYRVEHAKNLLQNTDNKIADVAEICGFNSASSFHRVFVKSTGKKPSEWRIN